MSQKNVTSQNFWSATGQWPRRESDFCGKFLGPLWKILTCRKSIFEKCSLIQRWYTSYVFATYLSISSIFFFTGFVPSGIQRLLRNLCEASFTLSNFDTISRLSLQNGRGLIVFVRQKSHNYNFIHVQLFNEIVNAFCE